MLDAAKEYAPAALVAQVEREALRPGQGLVLLANILASDVNAGYEDALWEVVRSVGGSEAGSLTELVALVERADSGPFVTFGLAGGRRVTIDRQRAVSTAPEVLARYEVAADRSPRLRGLAPSKPVVAALGVPSSAGTGEER